ncbi:MAG: pyridoxamine 5'-phosphate oxidase family protein [Pseudomonadota bacterium]
MSDILTDVDAVQERVGKLAGARDMKVIDFLDPHAKRWLSLSSLIFLAFGDEQSLCMTLGGGSAGFVEADDERSLRVPLALLEAPRLAAEGMAFGSLSLVPGMTETLRINGRVKSVQDSCLALTVEECYLHCGKALLRSDFWAPQTTHEISDENANLIPQSRLMALATISANGQVDVSPKGDPAGALLQEDAGNLWYPDRPGNRRIDSFRNIVERPDVAVIALAPGCQQFLEVTGSAAISTDESQLKAFEVQGKQPKLVTRIEVKQMAIKNSKAMADAALWPVTTSADINSAEIFKSHVKLSKERGLGASITRTIVSVPGLLKRSLDSDYKDNMY